MLAQLVDAKATVLASLYAAVVKVSPLAVGGYSVAIQMAAAAATAFSVAFLSQLAAARHGGRSDRKGWVGVEDTWHFESL